MLLSSRRGRRPHDDDHDHEDDEGDADAGAAAVEAATAAAVEAFLRHGAGADAQAALLGLGLEAASSSTEAEAAPTAGSSSTSRDGRSLLRLLERQRRASMMQQQQQQQTQQARHRRQQRRSPSPGGGRGGGARQQHPWPLREDRAPFERRNEEHRHQPPPQQSLDSYDDADNDQLATVYVPDTTEWERVECLLPVRGGGRGGGRALERRVLESAPLPGGARLHQPPWRAVTLALPPDEVRWRRSRHGGGSGSGADKDDLPPLWLRPLGGEQEQEEDGGGRGGLFGAVPVSGAGSYALLPAASASSSSSQPSARWRAARLVQSPVVVVADLDALVGGPVAAAGSGNGSSNAHSRRRRPSAGRNERALARLRDAFALSPLAAAAAAASAAVADAAGASTAAAAALPPPPLPPPAAAALVFATPRRWPMWERLWAERQDHLPPPDAVVAASCTEIYVRLHDGGGGSGSTSTSPAPAPPPPRWGLDKHWRVLLRDEARRSGWSRARAERVARALMARYGGEQGAVVTSAPPPQAADDGGGSWLPALPAPMQGAAACGDDNNDPSSAPSSTSSRDARMGPPDRQSAMRVQMLVRKRLLAPFLRDLGAALDQLAAEAATAAAVAAAASEDGGEEGTTASTLPWAAVHVHAERGWAVVDLVPGAATLPRAVRHLGAAGRLGAAWPGAAPGAAWRQQRERERRALRRELEQGLEQMMLSMVAEEADDGADDHEHDLEAEEQQQQLQQQQQQQEAPLPLPPPPVRRRRPRVVSVRLPPDEGPPGAGTALPLRWAGSAGLGARSAEEQAAAPLLPGADVVVVVGDGRGPPREAAEATASPEHDHQQQRPLPPFAAGLMQALEEAGLC